MGIEIKAKPAMGALGASRVMKRLYKWMGYAMIVAVGWSLWKQGLVAPYMQSQDFRDYISDYSSAPRGWNKTVTVQSSSNSFDVFGGPFDGFTLGSVIGPVFAALELTSPPDLTACIVTTQTDRAVCTLRLRDNDFSSYCPNSVECDWTINVPSAGPYAIVVFDVDDHWSQGVWDLVDASILVNNPNDRVEKLEKLTRLLIRLVSPTTLDRPDWAPSGEPIVFNSGEKERRERGFVILTPDRAAEGVILSQSSLYVFPSQ